MDTVILPRKLTAENGAKALLMGEFHETFTFPNPDYCGCEECLECRIYAHIYMKETVDVKVPVSWSTIKNIHDKVVEGLSI